MPELPEIETIKNVIEPQVQGHVINNVIVNRPEVISYPAAEKFCSAVAGQEISSMSRRGKWKGTTLLRYPPFRPFLADTKR